MESLRRFYSKAKEIYKGENTGHDYGHIRRVLLYCKKIQRYEQNVDKYVLTISTLFHDVHRVMQGKVGRYVTPKESLPYIEDTLIKLGVNKSKLDKILYVIENHDLKVIDNNEIELKILQDADILDALGRRGLKRTLTYCKTHNIPISMPEIALNDESYMPDINPISTKHYVYNTMIPNADRIKTETGKKLARNKVAILRKFIYK